MAELLVQSGLVEIAHKNVYGSDSLHTACKMVLTRQLLLIKFLPCLNHLSLFLSLSLSLSHLSLLL